MTAAALHPVRLARNAAGDPYSPLYDDVYASRDGAPEQARHVFLGGNDLPQRWRGRAQFVIVETGFGLGTNFLAAWQAWRGDSQRPARLHVVSTELHPLPAADLRAAAPPELASLADALAQAWPLPLPGLHRLEFDGGAVALTLALGDARALVPQLVAGADAFFLDGFAPDRNPALWEPALLRALARLARPGATLATWCAARAVRDALAACGFAVAARPGFGHKREMTVARFAPRWTVRRHEPPAAHAGARTALVVGAGLAGSTTAHALAQRGWQVTVLEAGAHAASGASALPWGLLHPQLTADDSRLARLTRAGFLRAAQWLQAVPAPAVPLWSRCGVFQKALDDAEARRWRAQVEAAGWPAAYAQALDGDAAATRLGVRPGAGGLWFEGAGIVAAAAWCRALLAPPAPITLLAQRRVARVQPLDGGWAAFDEAGALLGRAAQLVVANALDATALLGAALPPLRPVRGRISQLDPISLSTLPRAGMAGDGYLVRAPDGTLAVGATYELADGSSAGSCSEPAASGALTLEQAHTANLLRFARLLPGVASPRATGVFEGVRCVAPDRLPLAGGVIDAVAMADGAAPPRGAHLDDLPRAGGLWVLVALGSRGLTLAPLLGELVADGIEGAPLPLERDLAAAVDPARFALRQWRRQADGAAPAVKK